MTGGKKSFVLYIDNSIIIDQLSDEEAGRLFRSIFEYQKEGIEPDFSSDPVLSMAFAVFKIALDRDAEKYEARCEKNRMNGRKGGIANARKNKQTLPNATEWVANQADNDNDNGNDNDSGNDSDSGSGNDMSTAGIPTGNQVVDTWDTQGRLGKGSIDYQQIADMYNNTCVSFPRLSKLSESRKRAIKARLQTYSVEDFQKMFEMAEGSSFLKGANNRNWSATFDWMVKDTNMAKILDGNYQDRQSEPQIPEKTPEEVEREKREEQEALDRIDKAMKREYVYDPEHPFQ